jgi:hypothetical protein
MQSRRLGFVDQCSILLRNQLLHRPEWMDPLKSGRMMGHGGRSGNEQQRNRRGHHRG